MFSRDMVRLRNISVDTLHKGDTEDDDDDNGDDDDYDNNNNNNNNEKLKENFGSCTRITFDRFTTKDSYTWNITHNTESTAV
jgi:cobalamin biosynthesis protein CobT